jgi:6-phosphogluconolactonase (cycloisomerase 2 family)
VGSTGAAGSQSVITQYKFGANQALVVNGTVNADAAAFSVITPNARSFYDAAYYSAAVDQFGISSSGTLSPLTPPRVSTGNAPLEMATSPDGHNVYVANGGTVFGPGNPTPGPGSITVYDVASDGTLTVAQTVTAGIQYASGVVVSPDGKSVYVSDSQAGTILEYNRSSAGTLTPKSTPSISAPVTGFIGPLVMTPDGRNLYASNDSGSPGAAVIGQYSVGSGGQLTAKPVATIASGGNTYTLTVSPNGHYLYAPSCTVGAVDEYSIGSTGELTPQSPASVSTPGCTYQLWMTANGASAYATNEDFSGNSPIGSVYQFNVSAAGALSPKTPAKVTTPGPDPVGIVIPPDQGPLAKFKHTTTGRKVRFNATGSSDSDGTVALYHWSFGDGTTQTGTSAKPLHTYKKGGRYRVTLTVTDDSGCSTALVFTGQTAYCNSDSAARISHTVKITVIKPSKLRVSPRSAQAGAPTCYAFRFSSNGRGVARATVRFAGKTGRTNGTGKVTICRTLAAGHYTAHASKKGYRNATASVGVRRTTPVVTG